MIDMGIVKGSAAQAQPLVVGIDVVYVHTDITRLDETDDNGNPVEIYSYHEVQYEKNEYIKMLAEKNQTLETNLVDTQMALCEIYESMGVL